MYSSESPLVITSERGAGRGTGSGGLWGLFHLSGDIQPPSTKMRVFCNFYERFTVNPAVYSSVYGLVRKEEDEDEDQAVKQSKALRSNHSWRLESRPCFWSTAGQTNGLLSHYKLKLSYFSLRSWAGATSAVVWAAACPLDGAVCCLMLLWVEPQHLQPPLCNLWDSDIYLNHGQIHFICSVASVQIRGPRGDTEIRARTLKVNLLDQIFKSLRDLMRWGFIKSARWILKSQFLYEARARTSLLFWTSHRQQNVKITGFSVIPWGHRN